MQLTTIKKTVGTSAANTAVTVSLPGGKRKIVHNVFVSYSGAPTQAGVTVKYKSGTGAAYDTVVLTGSANAQNTILPLDSRIVLDEKDGIEVTAPAGGGALTASVTIISQEL